MTTGFAAGRSLTALLLLVTSLLLPVAPMLEAAVMAADSHACCRKGGTCCHRSQRNTAGPLLNSSPECGSGCAQAPGLIVAVFAAGADCAESIPPAEFASIAFARVTALSSSYSAYLYQRPPPHA